MIGWIDGSAGASGDMLLGALVSAGVPLEVMAEPIAALDVGVTLASETVQRSGIAAVKVQVVGSQDDDTAVARSLDDVILLLQRLDLRLCDRAVAVFERLARAEASVHGVPISDIHFHEVGATDAIADIVGVCAGFRELNLNELWCSTLSVGSGTSQGAHGPIPIPAPAVLELMSGVAVIESGASDFEATTPTGAALLAEHVTHWGQLPAMTLDKIGLGAGDKNPANVVNALRLALGEPSEASVKRDGQATKLKTLTQTVVEANVDDLDPRVWPSVMEAVLKAGAFDVWLTPMLMKKGRPAHTVSALCTHNLASAVRQTLFTHTSTIGVREYEVTKRELARRSHSVTVRGHEIGVKVTWADGEIKNLTPEWDDLDAAARSLGMAAKEVMTEALLIARDMSQAWTEESG